MSEFKCPSSIIIAGPSQCGKTTFTRQLFQHVDCLFECPIRKIVYCYGHWQDSYREQENQVTLVEGIPEDISTLFPSHYCPGIIVLDDLMRNCSSNERILALFTKVSQHCDITCSYLTQNLFPPGTSSRSISHNAHYIIAFNNPRDTLGFRTQAQQAFEGQVPYVWESFQDATSQPYGYLMLDLHTSTPVTLRLCSNILPLSQMYPVVYVNKTMHNTNDPLAVDCSQHDDFPHVTSCSKRDESKWWQHGFVFWRKKPSLKKKKKSSINKEVLYQLLLL